MTRFERALADLKQQVIAMGGLAESMITDAWQGVLTQDRALLERVLVKEPRLDQVQVDIDRDAVRLITLFAPVARDLRFLLTIARITAEIERMGDEAVDTCEYSAFVDRPPEPGGDLRRMADCVLSMVREAVQVFAEERPDRAAGVMRLDAHVDTLYSRVVRDLLAAPPDAADARPRTAGLVLLARSLERIADHATNVCEEVLYFVEGADVRHQSGDRLLGP